MTRLVALALLTVACGPASPPRFYSIDSSFTEPQREVIRAAVDAWCVAADWCPEETLWAEHGSFSLVDDLPEHDECRHMHGCVAAGNNPGGLRVLIARNGPEPDSLDALWMIAAHEAGHFCIGGHTEHGLMAAVHKPADTLEVDDEAVRAWREGCAL